MLTLLRTGILVIISFTLVLFTMNLFKSDMNYKDQIAVLMYHHIYDHETSSGTITTKLFREQLTLLKNKGYQFITLQHMREFLKGSPIPDKAVLITFDDGYESFYDNAFPILQEMAIPAVNFIITGSLEHPQKDIPPKMSREQIKTMLLDSSLIEIQCHTDGLHNKNTKGKALLVGHLTAAGKAETDEQYNKRIISDTQACSSKLSALTAEPIDALAYPYGIYSGEAIQNIQAAGIQYAFTILTKMTTRQVNHLVIPRINAGSPNITPEGLENSIQRSIVPIK